jgi:hypothetical protein
MRLQPTASSVVMTRWKNVILSVTIMMGMGQVAGEKGMRWSRGWYTEPT